MFVTFLRTLAWAVLRFVGIAGYLLGVGLLLGCVSWPVFVVWRGYPFPYIAWPLQIGMCLCSLVIFGLGLFLARWTTNRSYAGTSVPKGKFTGHLVMVPAAGILCWLTIVPTESLDDAARVFPPFVSMTLFLVATVDGHVTLTRYKRFLWHTYILMGLGAGSALASLVVSPMFVMHANVLGVHRSSTFAATTGQFASIIGQESFADAIREPKRFRALEDFEGAMLVCDAHVGESGEPCRLSVSDMERYLPRSWLARDGQSLRFVVVVGPFGLLPSSQPFGRPAWGHPFLAFDWQGCELLQQGKLRLSAPGGMPRRHYPNEVEGRLCDAAKELAQQL